MMFSGVHKMKYVIWNLKDNEHYFGTFATNEDARDWIINHLDLSKEWSFKLLKRGEVA